MSLNKSSLHGMNSSTTSRRSSKGKRQPSTSSDSVTSSVELVRRMADLREKDPARFASELRKLKENNPDIEELMKIYPPAVRLHGLGSPSDAPPPLSVAATDRSLHASPSRRSRTTMSTSLRSGDDGNSFTPSSLDLSAISGGDQLDETERTFVPRTRDDGSRRSTRRGAHQGDQTTSSPSSPSSLAASALGVSPSSFFLEKRKGDAGTRTRPPGVDLSGRARMGSEEEVALREEPLSEMSETGAWDAALNDPGSSIQHLLSGIPSMPPEDAEGSLPPDVHDARCLHLHESVLLRGTQGRYLRVMGEEIDDAPLESNSLGTSGAGGARVAGRGDSFEEDPGNPASKLQLQACEGGGSDAAPGAQEGDAHPGGMVNEAESKTMFVTDADGSGIGDQAEVVQFVSADRRQDKGPLVYGDVVMVKSAAAKGKLLRLAANGTAVFARVAGSWRERWEVLPYFPIGGVSLSSDPSREAGAEANGWSYTGGRSREGGLPARAEWDRGRRRKGAFVRNGERVQLVHTDERSGDKISLMMRPANFHGGKWKVTAGRPEDYPDDRYSMWELCSAGVPYLPSWRRDRPYLTGEFLLRPDPSELMPAVTRLFSDKPSTVVGKARATVSASPGTPAPARPAPRWKRVAYPSLDDADHEDGDAALDELPEALQEHMLLNELLSALMGYPGRYIVIEGVGRRRQPSRDKSPAELSEAKFTVEPGAVDPSLLYLAERILPLCDSYVRVKHFANERGRHEYGKVVHALVAAIRRLIREYLVLVAQLEHQLLQGKLSLQRLWFYVQPSLRSMQSLESLTVTLRDSRGGELLKKLKAAAGACGDEATRKLYTFLLYEASVPYLEMVEAWIYRGSFIDQYGEFMIEQAEDVHEQDILEDFGNRYWLGKYKLRKAHVIGCLVGREQKVLTTGKYLNFVRERGRGVDSPFAGPIPADPGPAGEGLYARVIDEAYGFASRCLMNLIVKEGELLPRLESIKHYFLLDRGDFFEYLLDCAEGELNKRIAEISVPRLESLLHLSVQMSSASQDPFKDDLGLEFSDRNLLKELARIHSHRGVDSDGHSKRPRAPSVAGAATLASAESTSPPRNEGGHGAVRGRAPGAVSAGSATRTPESSNRPGGDYAQRIIQGTAELRGVEGLMMSYRVRWPVSLVLSKRSLTKYQMLFRHLFFAKHVQRLLFKSWRDHQGTKHLELKGLMMEAYQLRQRMLHFVQSIVYYMMVEVIEPQWHEFMDDLKKLCADEPRETEGRDGIEAGSVEDARESRQGTLDDILKRHNEFQDSCLKECMLTNVGLLQSLMEVMISCLHFGDQGALFAEERRRADEQQQQEEEVDRSSSEANPKPKASGGGGMPDLAFSAGVGRSEGRGGQRGLTGERRTKHLDRRSRSMREALDTERFRQYIQQAQESFDASLSVFAKQLWVDASGNYQSHLMNLCSRLDYNGYFSGKYAPETNLHKFLGQHTRTEAL